MDNSEQEMKNAVAPRRIFCSKLEALTKQEGMHQCIHEYLITGFPLLSSSIQGIAKALFELSGS